MKKISLLILSLTFALLSVAQKSEDQLPKRKAGVTFSSFGSADGLQSAKGGASFSGKYFYSIGLNYMYSLHKWLDFETGMEYSHYTISIHPNLPPDMDRTPYDEQFSLMSIPVSLRINFLKYCFVNGGFELDFDPAFSSPIDSQDGIGSLLGVGLKYDSKLGVSAFVNPYFKIHSLISLSGIENHQRLFESGYRFGIMYKLK